MAVEPREDEEDQRRREHRDHAGELVRDGPQDRVVRREVPHREDVLGGLQGVRGHEVRAFEEPSAELGRVEDDEGEEHEEDPRAPQVLDRVVGVEGHAVHRDPVRVLVLLDLHAVGVVRADLVQRHDVGGDQAEEDERDPHHVQRVEAAQGRVRDDVVPPDPQRQRLADAEGQRPEQRDDHLRAPVRHLAPGQQVAEERLRHEAEVDEHPEDPDELPRGLVRAVEQGPEHVQVDDDEERGGPGGVHVADEPPPFDVAHDVLDGLEGERRVRLVEHREPDAGDDLEHEHQQGQRAEEVPEVEVLRRVVVREVLVPQLREREPGVRPFEQAGQQSHHAVPSSSPMTIRVSLRYMCGGTSRFVGAGTPW